MDGAAARCRTARERLLFPLRRARCGAPTLHCKRASLNGTLRSVTLAGSAPGGSEFRATLHASGERVAPEKVVGGGKAENRQGPALREAGRERRFNDGYVRDVPPQGRASRELDQVPSLERIRDF